MKTPYEKPTLEIVDLGISTPIAGTQCSVLDKNLFADASCRIIVEGETDTETLTADSGACNVSGYCYHTSANLIFGS